MGVWGVCVGQISPCQWALWSQRLIPPSSTQRSSCGTWRKELLFLCRYSTQALFVSLLQDTETIVPPQSLHLLGVSLPVCCLNCSRCTASALSSLPGSMVERRAFPSGSRLTPSPWETLESTRSTSTLPPAKSKSLRCTLIPSWVELGGVFHPSLSLNVTITTLLLRPCSAKRGRS